MVNLIPKCKALLHQASRNPEALLFLVSGAIDHLRLLEEGAYSKPFEESWSPQVFTETWN